MSVDEAFGINTVNEQEYYDIVIDFILNHPGCIAEDILRGQQQIGRKKLFKILSALKKQKVIIVNKSKPKARNKKLYVIKVNPLAIISKELEEFEKAFCSLLMKVKEQINTSYSCNRQHHYKLTSIS